MNRKDCELYPQKASPFESSAIGFSYSTRRAASRTGSQVPDFRRRPLPRPGRTNSAVTEDGRSKERSGHTLCVCQRVSGPENDDGAEIRGELQGSSPDSCQVGPQAHVWSV
jgi:hypothetical protein